MNPRMQALERQLAKGWSWLRFEEALEEPFQQQYQLWQVPFRLSLLGVAAVLIGATPLFDTWFLHPPQEFAQAVHWVQLGIMLPAILVGMLFTWAERLRPLSDWVGMVTVTIVAGGLLYQRQLGALYDYMVPTELVCVTVASVYVMGGLGFWRFTPLAILLLGLTAANEVISYGSGSATLYTIVAQSMQFLIAGVAGYLQEHFARGAWMRRELLTILASHDSLTGLLNVRAFDQRYQQMHSLAARESKPIAVALVDLDYFKQYNDGYGHPAGDECLRRVAEIIGRRFQRESDIRARVGGEEFALVCHDLSLAQAEQLLEELRLAIEQLAIPHQYAGGEVKVVTASIGAVWFRPREGLSADSARHMADIQLYESKHAGRNRVSLVDGRRTRSQGIVKTPLPGSLPESL